VEGRPEGGPCFEQESMSLEVLRTLAAAMTIIAAAMVAANWNARITVCGFALFIAASVAWIDDGIIEPKNSLIIQNSVLLVINILGVWRWLPRAGKETAAPVAEDRAMR
jgi:hypothetical protein